ncbi:MAG TPA: SsrA-binding protein SmpB [Thermomicrobiales bacterium]|nr:SsrA-binding protein SmpB [Thermomicrobiales bacterium]
MTSATSSKNDRRTDRVVVTNRRALHDYHILESIETGIVLSGTEIKSLRAGHMSIAEAYVRVADDELWLIGSHISPYAFGTHANHDPHRNRKLLAHGREIRQLRETTEQKGMTLIPLRVAIRNGRAKVDVGVARAKKLYDKRQAEAERDSKRDVQRMLAER